MINRLFELSLFVDHVLPYNGVVLLELKLVGRVGPVLRSRIEVTGTCRRLELDFFALALGDCGFPGWYAFNTKYVER